MAYEAASIGIISSGVLPMRFSLRNFVLCKYASLTDMQVKVPDLPTSIRKIESDDELNIKFAQFEPSGCEIKSKELDLEDFVLLFFLELTITPTDIFFNTTPEQ